MFFPALGYIHRFPVGYDQVASVATDIFLNMVCIHYMRMMHADKSAVGRHQLIFF